eukprot:CAMPEP_0178902338 /NCGR_PEP_ID=MMETSP0786-20121207/4546_1 /TAXON_ID=186022 /ORGANISM="Thalassionema frauenfeldii, Strain CCMP 1798" /LENGTH=74 /DNA_ID=CAMNT_0020573587 /DNA_START=423 /DNA_END=643 /DNA_ORIENTATION=-
MTQHFLFLVMAMRNYMTENSNVGLRTVAPAVNYQARGPAYDAANGALNPKLQRNGPYETTKTSTTIPEWNVHHG